MGAVRGTRVPRLARVVSPRFSAPGRYAGRERQLEQIANNDSVLVLFFGGVKGCFFGFTTFGGVAAEDLGGGDLEGKQTGLVLVGIGREEYHHVRLAVAVAGLFEA